MRMSSAERRLNCPGSFHAEQGLPETTSEAAASGTLIHTVAAKLIIADTVTETLTDREMYIASWLADEWVKLDCGPGIGEQEITITDSSGETKWTGHPDRYAMSLDKSKIILAEWKTGRNKVETADGNVQLRLYAVALWQMYGRIVEAHLLCAGNDEGESHTVVTLYPLQLQAAYDVAITIWKRCQSKKAKRVTGDHCKYCRAEGTVKCPESCKTVTALAVIESQLPDDPAKLAVLFEQSKVAERICKKIQDYAKAYVLGGGILPGYELTKPVQKGVVKDIVAAWEKCSGFISQEQFLSCCKVTLGELRKALPKGAKAEEVLGSALDFQTVQGHIEKVSDNKAV